MDDEALAQIKSINPATVRVYNGDDDHRDVAVQNTRNRWSRLSRTLAAMPWSKYELLDKKGALVGIVENGAPAGDVEELGRGQSGAAANQTRLLLELMLRAQREALTYRDKEVHTLLHGVANAMDAMTRAMSATQTMWQAQAEASHIIAQANAGGDIEQITKLIEASPKLMQTLAPILARLLGSGSPAPTPAPRKPVPPLAGNGA